MAAANSEGISFDDMIKGVGADETTLGEDTKKMSAQGATPTLVDFMGLQMKVSKFLVKLETLTHLMFTMTSAKVKIIGNMRFS